MASGQVLRIDPRNGAQTVLAQLTPGLDNCTFVDGRLFVSNFTGEITEILGGGETRTVLPGGLNWPLDLAVGADGTLYIADGTYFYALRSGGALQTVGHAVPPGYPGFLRGLAPSGRASSSSRPRAARSRATGPPTTKPTSSQTDSTSSTAWRSRPAGRSWSPSRAPGGCCRSDRATSRCWPRACDEPVGVAIDPDGTVLVSESVRAGWSG